MAEPQATAASHYIAGVPQEFDARVGIAERLVYINQFINCCDDPALLKWIRNSLSAPHGMATRKLYDMDELPEKGKKDLPNEASVK